MLLDESTATETYGSGVKFKSMSYDEFGRKTYNIDVQIPGNARDCFWRFNDGKNNRKCGFSNCLKCRHGGKKWTGKNG